MYVYPYYTIVNPKGYQWILSHLLVTSIQPPQPRVDTIPHIWHCMESVVIKMTHARARTHKHTHTHTESHNEILPFYAVTLAHMGGRTNAFKVLVGRHHLQDLGVDGTIRVKWIFK